MLTELFNNTSRLGSKIIGGRKYRMQNKAVVTCGIFAHRGADIILMADDKQVHVLEK